MEGDNAYLCEELGKRVPAVKRTAIRTLPQMLCVHLKRFEFDYHNQTRHKLRDRWGSSGTDCVGCCRLGCDSGTVLMQCWRAERPGVWGGGQGERGARAAELAAWGVLKRTCTIPSRPRTDSLTT